MKRSLRILTKELDRSHWGESLSILERSPRYPLGDDLFRIDHGKDYFAFFRRMGEPLTFLVEEEGLLLGALTAVRFLSPDAWYVCDLKIEPAYQGLGVAQMLIGAFRDHAIPHCDQFFAISMNPVSGPNRVVRFIQRFAKSNEIRQKTLLIYSKDVAEMQSLAPRLESILGPISYLSLVGLKDIILESTGRPMPLWHIQHGPRRDRENSRKEVSLGGIHMFCLPMEIEVQAQPSASATILYHGLESFDWSSILTSDI